MEYVIPEPIESGGTVSMEYQVVALPACGPLFEGH
jgi:hypothetical protein